MTIVFNPTEAQEHLDLYPAPDGRTLMQLSEGPRAAHESARCLWPACFAVHKTRLANRSPEQVAKHLWMLYDFKDESGLRYRWQFWRDPPIGSFAEEWAPTDYESDPRLGGHRPQPQEALTL